MFRGPEFQAQKMCTWVKLLTDLQILGRELHKKMRLAAGLYPDPLLELYRCPMPLAVIMGRGRREGKRNGWE